MRSLLPPVGISHVTESIEDVYRAGLAGKQRLILHPAAQPNSFPHLGTVTTLAATFALAQRLKSTLGVEPEIVLWELENAPALQKIENGQTYYKTLGSTDEDGESRSEKHLKEFRRLLSIYSALSGVPYRTWSYAEFQALPEVRQIILDVLDAEQRIAPIICPSERKIKVRFACPVCSYAAKQGGTLLGRCSDGSRQYRNTCFAHGEYAGELSSINNQLFDVNTPARALAREIYYIRKMIAEQGQNMMSDGADWVHYAALNLEALLCMGVELSDVPLRFFAPVILDEYGAKLAKSAQVGSQAYSGLAGYVTDSRLLEQYFGDDVHPQLWQEVRGWFDSPKSIYRNYSLKYFDGLLGRAI